MKIRTLFSPFFLSPYCSSCSDRSSFYQYEDVLTLLKESKDDQWEGDDHIPENSLEDAIAATKLGKAPGQDELTTYVLKYVGGRGITEDVENIGDISREHSKKNIF